MTIYYTSDLHIGHKLVAGLRGFVKDDVVDDGDIGYLVSRENPVSDTNAHDAALAKYWDKTVKPGDSVFILGDTGMGQFDTVVLPWFHARKGIKHLITGNHDPVHPARSDALKLQMKWLEVFDSINPYLTRKLRGNKVMLSHFPYASYGDGDQHGEPGEGRWAEWRIPESLGKLLVHGHTHGTERAHGDQFHVGWDAWGRFVTQEEILDWVEERRG